MIQEAVLLSLYINCWMLHRFYFNTSKHLDTILLLPNPYSESVFVLFYFIDKRVKETYTKTNAEAFLS